MTTEGVRITIRKQAELRYSDVTPKEVYLNRRRFLGATAAAIGALAAPHSAFAAPTQLNAIKAPAHFNVTDKATPLAIIAGYNNFYEFGTGKEDPSHNAPSGTFPTRGRCASRERGLTSRRRRI